MPMNNMMNSVNQYETPNVRNINNMQASVSPFYASASNMQYSNLSLNMPMNRELDTLQLAIWPVILNHHIMHLMLLMFHLHVQLVRFIIRLHAFIVTMAE